MAKAVENKPATVSNLVDRVISKTAQDATQRVFSNVVGLEKFQHITDDITALLKQEMVNQSFMTVQLELSEQQHKALLDFVGRAVISARDRYLGKLKKDERTKAVVAIVEGAMSGVIEEALSGIGQEINRGAAINATAVSANAKKEDHNSIELNYSKEAGDITIPTRGVFISTNCVQVIQDSCKVDLTEEKPAEKKGRKTAAGETVDETTGEIISE